MFALKPESIIKKISIFMICALAIGTFFFAPNRARALAPIDQGCYSGVNACINGLNSYQGIKNHQILGQVYKPGKNMLDAIAIYVSSGAVGTQATITLKYVDLAPGTPTLWTGSQTVGYTPTWIVYDFPDFAIVPDAYDAFYLSTTSDTAHWLASSNDGGNGYTRGYAISDNNPLFGVDFGFATYGYNAAVITVVPPTATPTPTVTPSGSSGLIGSTPGRHYLLSH